MLFTYKTKPFISLKLQEELIDVIQRCGKEKEFDRNETIVSDDARMNSFILVKEGIAGEAFVNYEINKSVFMGLVPAGCIAGYLNFLTRENSNDAVFALRKTRVIIASHDSVRAHIGKDFDLYDRFVQHCAKCVESCFEALSIVSTLPIETRLVALLGSLIIAEKGRLPDDEWVSLPTTITRSEFAQVINATLLSIDLIFGQWKKDSLYSYKNKRYNFRRDLFDIFSNWNELS